jgi:hypothetical protein
MNTDNYYDAERFSIRLQKQEFNWTWREKEYLEQCIARIKASAIERGMEKFQDNPGVDEYDNVIRLMRQYQVDANGFELLKVGMKLELALSGIELKEAN